MFCKNCGNRISDNAIACPICKTQTGKSAGASQEFRTYSPMWANQQDEEAVTQSMMKNTAQPAEEKSNKKVGIIAGVIIAVAVVIAVVAVVLSLL